MSKKPTLKQIEYFLCLANTLNFRQAAANLAISQPTLTAQITALEDTLQLTLFERSRTGTFLSPQGKDLLSYAKRLMDAAEDLVQASQHLVHGPATTFRLGVPPTLGPYLLPFVLPTLHKNFYQLKLFVREAAPRKLEQMLIDGEFDLILSPLPLASTELDIEPLFKEPLKLVVPREHEFSQHNTICAEDIRGQKVLTLEEQHHFHRQVHYICEKFNANVLRDFEGTSLDTLRQMVVMGIGIAFLPGLYVHSELHRPEELHVCELAEMPIVREHALAWRKTSANRLFFRELAGHIREIVATQLSDVVEV